MRELSRIIVVSDAHPSLPGHFPGNPIVPGVVLLDRILAEIQTEIGTAKLIAIPTAKFHRPLAANESVSVSIRIINEADTIRARFVASNGQGIVAEGSFVLSAVGADR